MSARPNHTVIRYFLEYADKINLHEELEAFNESDYAVKIRLLFEKCDYYFIVDNFEHSGVTISLYAGNGTLIESKQYTFNRAQAKPSKDFYTVLNALNGFFQ